MFRIGEFSTIAQVSGRQLRHYDQLGLLKPVRIDVETGYRYYSASQLPRLNRILALKELGLTLDQIGQFLEENVSSDDLRKMLHRKQEEIEQAMRESLMHLNYIESRIRQIEHTGVSRDEDVVVKSVPAQRYLSLRTVVSPQLGDARDLLLEMQRVLPLSCRTPCGMVSSPTYRVSKHLIHKFWSQQSFTSSKHRQGNARCALWLIL